MTDSERRAAPQADAPPAPSRKREREASGEKQAEEQANTETKKVRPDAEKSAQPTFGSFATATHAFAAQHPAPAQEGDDKQKDDAATHAIPPPSEAQEDGPAAKDPPTAEGRSKAQDASEPPVPPQGQDATTTSGSQEQESKRTATSAPSSSLGFGAFAARSAPFQSATALSDKAHEAQSGPSNWTKTEDVAAPQPDVEDIVVRKRSIRRPDAELVTGEEEERTVASTRAKLYHMAKDQSWKERGTGVLKINLHTQGEGADSARLVMRSDAVLRVILNVKLFPGMQCDAEQERFLRFVAMESEGLVHFAVKLANAQEASAFLKQLRDHIPARKPTDKDSIA